MKRKYVLDASMGWPPVFCPVEGDLDGEHSIIVGLNFLGLPPAGGELVAVIHPDGQEAVDAFCEAHAEALIELGAAYKEKSS